MKRQLVMTLAVCAALAGAAAPLHGATPGGATGVTSPGATSAEPTVGADYADARRIAAGRKVPVLLEFYADW